MAVKPPNIPTLSRKVDNETRTAFAAIKDWFSKATSDGGVVTANSLPALPADLVSSSDPAISQFFDGSIPPSLKDFTVTGAFRTIMAQWDDPLYKWFSYVEVWRNTADDLGTAQMIGTTISTLYSDMPPDASLSVDYYYWGRVVSTSGIKGPFSSTLGTMGNTANDPAYMIDLLSKSLDAMAPTEIFGTTDIVIPAANFAIRGFEAGEPATGTYPFIVARTPLAGDPEDGPFTGPYAVFMNTAYINQATITSAMIEDLRADKLTIPGTASIWDAIITQGKITNAYIDDIIQSTVYTPGSVGWIINKNGYAEFQNIKARGDIEATSLGANKAVGTANIIDAAVDTLQIKGQAVTIPIASATGVITLPTAGAWVEIGSVTIDAMGNQIVVTGITSVKFPITSTEYATFVIPRTVTMKFTVDGVDVVGSERIAAYGSYYDWEDGLVGGD
jgi:hypothetical protein